MMVPTGCPETSVINPHYLLYNKPKERSSHLLRGEGVETRQGRALLKKVNKITFLSVWPNRTDSFKVKSALAKSL
jgi:hypothetical protein